MLDAFATYENYLIKIPAAYSVVPVTQIKISLEYANCEQLLQLLTAILNKMQSSWFL